MIRTQQDQAKTLLKYWRRNRAIIGKTVVNMMEQYPGLGRWEAIHPDFHVVVVASPEMMQRKEFIDPKSKLESIA